MVKPTEYMAISPIQIKSRLMKLKTFSFILKIRYHIQLDIDSFLLNVKFSKNHKKVLQELFKQIVKKLFPLQNRHFKVLILKNRQQNIYMEIEISYEELTQTFYIQNTVLYYGRDDISSASDNVHVIWSDFCFDDRFDKLIYQEKQKKYTKLLNRVLKKRRSIVKQAYFVLYSEHSSDMVCLSPANILVQSQKTTKKIKSKESTQKQLIPINYVLKISYNNKNYEIIKTKHLYHKRNGKYRIEGFSDIVLKQIILSALKQGDIFQYKKVVLIFPKDKEKSNYYSILVDFNQKKKSFVIITIFADDTQYRKLFHFTKERDAIYLEDIAFDDLSM